jgi:hypothetical protein
VRRAQVPSCVAIVALFLTGCQSGPRPHPASSPAVATDDIKVSVGPCFGFCPVYEVTVSADGTIAFEGVRHTAVLGERRRRTGAGTYRALETALAAYRPARGTTANVECDAAISDTSPYKIEWIEPDGTRTVATHQSRCPSGPGHELDQVLGKIPDQLGIAPWARQTTRPGEGRG